MLVIILWTWQDCIQNEEFPVISLRVQLVLVHVHLPETFQ